MYYYSCKWLRACIDGPQAMDACGQSIYYLKTNYKVIGNRMLAAFGADTSEGIGSGVVWVEATVEVVP